MHRFHPSRQRRALASCQRRRERETGGRGTRSGGAGRSPCRRCNSCDPPLGDDVLPDLHCGPGVRYMVRQPSTLIDTWSFDAFFTTNQRRGSEHGDRRLGPPRPSDHRASPRRLQNIRVGTAAIRGLRRKRHLTGPGRDRLQPDPRIATITGPALARATTPIIRRKPIAIPGRLASSVRRLVLHPPVTGPNKRL